ncbi:ABC transporter substrate-binding protein [Rhodococcoides yunnanense]|uniref:ABC transporter substrate-binding protein n=1 Tax=Rhodococcoides yunnanense TaxID=278209 RepID=UPI0009323793|nr:ABC transporter substrate-binding protein [Rhodococcus yunnanensis]
MRKIRVLPVLVAAALLAPLTACSTTGSENSMSLMVDVGYLPKHAPFFAAVDRGFFDAEGLDVTVMPGSGSGNTVAAVDTGKVDAGWADFGVTVLNQGRGAQVTQVDLLQARSAYAVVGMSDGDIHDWDDLPGKTIATEGAGAMTAMWPYALSKLGLTDRDVDVIHAASSAKIPGLVSGQWDANLALSVSDGPAIDSLGKVPVVLKWSDLGIDLYGNGIIFSNEELKNNPDKVTRFNRALQRAYLWSCENPEAAADSFHKEVQGYETSTVVLALDEQCALNNRIGEESKPFGVMTDEGVQQMLDVSREFLGLDPNSTLTPAQVYSNDYIDPLPTGDISAP